jgi:crotonobetainyl-CoA:carnitine CoA-transferase CaiB-like acyl-CoA transferase
MFEPSPLDGIRILSFTQLLLGPAGVQYLADLGADVVKVEPPGGAWERHWSGCDSFLNGCSLFHLMTHRNTRSISLDLKDPRGQAVARRLVAQADVLVQNFRPGVMERWGLDYEQLRAINPRLIYLSVSGYGTKGPYRSLPGQDLLIQALTGLADVTGRADGPPTAAGVSLVDHHGATLLAMGVMAALLQRMRTGEGRHVEVTMTQAALDLQLESLTYHLNGYPVHRSHSGLASGTEPAPYGIYQTRDGHVALSLVPVKLLYELTQEERLVPYLDPADAWPKRNEIYDLLEAIMLTRTTAEWVEPLRAKGAWVQAVNSYDDCFADPIVQELDPVMTVEHPKAGPLKLLKFPIKFGGQEMPVRSLPPETGQHNAEVLREAGFAEAEIDQLVREKVLGSQPS